MIRRFLRVLFVLSVVMLNFHITTLTAYGKADEDAGFFYNGHYYERYSRAKGMVYVITDRKIQCSPTAAPHDTPVCLNEKDIEVSEFAPVFIPEITQTPTPLPTSTPTPTPAYRYDAPMGNIGRFCIRDAGVDVALNEAYVSDGYAYAKQYCDAADSAFYIWYGREWMYEDSYQLIGDHCNQGFSAIEKCVPGETYAEIYDRNGVYRRYICTDIIKNALNLDTGFLMPDGTVVTDIYRGPDTLLVYTCYPKHPKVIIIIFKEEKQ